MPDSVGGMHTILLHGIFSGFRSRAMLQLEIIALRHQLDVLRRNQRTHGLVKGTFISTEAMSSLVMFTSKVVAFREFGALPPTVIANGLIVGTSLMLGAWIAKRFVLKMDESRFRGLMDIVLFIAGVAMLFGAFV